MSERMDYQLAQKIVRDYVCATCWHHLELEHLATDPNICTVHCSSPDCKGEGFVTKAYVSMRKEQDHFDSVDAYTNIGEALGVKSEMSAEQALKDLRF